VTEPGGDYGKRLVRLAFLLIGDQAEAEQVVRDVLVSGPPEDRDYRADHGAVGLRCRAIIRGRKRLPPD